MSTAQLLAPPPLERPQLEPRRPRPRRREPVPHDAGPRPTGAAALLAAVAAGDPLAWRTLVQRHDHLLHHMAGRYRLPAGEVDDVVQATRLSLVEHVADIRDPERLSAWLVTTTLRHALAAVRRRRHETPLGDHDVVDPNHPDPADQVNTQLRIKQLRQALATLPPKERRLIEALLLPEELSYREVSRRLDMPIGSIGPIRQRAMVRLQRRLVERVPGSP